MLLNFVLFALAPKGFFPQQSRAISIGFVDADQSISFQAMQRELRAIQKTVAARSGSRARGCLHGRGTAATNTGFLFSQSASRCPCAS